MKMVPVRAWATAIGLALMLAAVGCGSTDEFTRADAIERVQREADVSRAEAECLVDGVLGEGLDASDFLDDSSSDPRFARVFERYVASCLL